MIVTAPTKLTTDRYIRLKQYQSELVIVALAALGTDSHEVSDETLAQWAADDIVPHALFWMVDEHAVLPVLRGTYMALKPESSRPSARDSAEDRLTMMLYDAEKLAAEKARWTQAQEGA